MKAITRRAITVDRSAASVAEHKAKMREWYPKGSTVYTILRHVSASGMSRQISPVSIQWQGYRTPEDRQGAELRFPSYSAAVVLGYPLRRDWPSDSLTVRGCGMDMGYEVAHNLSHALYGDGYALKHAWL